MSYMYNIMVVCYVWPSFFSCALVSDLNVFSCSLPSLNFLFSSSSCKRVDVTSDLSSSSLAERTLDSLERRPASLNWRPGNDHATDGIFELYTCTCVYACQLVCVCTQYNDHGLHVWPNMAMCSDCHDPLIGLWAASNQVKEFHNQFMIPQFPPIKATTNTTMLAQSTLH